jgi:predicted NBD/HSP70 family sugar kinase
MKRHDTATPALLRRINAGAVLDSLRAVGELSVSELVTRTDLSRPTVDAAVADLVRMGVAVEANGVPEATSRPRRGRPARRYRFRAEAGHLLGIDIAEETVQVVVANLSGALVAERSRPVGLDVSRRRRLQAVRAAARAALAQAEVRPADLVAVVAGSPGTVDTATGRISFCTAIPEWSGLDLAATLRAAFDCPVLVENDANLAAIGESWRGIAHGCRDVVFFLLGARTGAGLLSDGRLLRGHDGGAGELGFLDLWEESRTTRGELARNSADLVAELLGTGGRRPSRASLRRPEDRGSLSWGVETRPLIDGALAGDENARAGLERFVASAGYALVSMSLLLSPELFVIGGGTAADDVLVDPLRRILSRLLEGKAATPPRVEASTLGTRAVVLGAVRHGLDYVEPRLLDRFDDTRSYDTRSYDTHSYDDGSDDTRSADDRTQPCRRAQGRGSERR